MVKNPKNDSAIDEKLLISYMAGAKPQEDDSSVSLAADSAEQPAVTHSDQHKGASRSRDRLADYTNTFVVPTPSKMRLGAYIDRELHRKITAIVSVSGTREVTIGSYLDNVLREHFRQYADEVKLYCQKSVSRIIQ